MAGEGLSDQLLVPWFGPNLPYSSIWCVGYFLVALLLGLGGRGRETERYPFAAAVCLFGSAGLRVHSCLFCFVWNTNQEVLCSSRKDAAKTN
jgi:hypothetical protein